MELVYDLKEDGWASVRIADAAQHLDFTCSYISDPLGSMATAAAMLLAGSREESFSFQDEPGEYRFVLTRGEADLLSIRVLWFDQSFSGRRNRFGKQIFHCEWAVLDFVGQVFVRLHTIFTVHGLEGYKRIWRNGDFPVRAYEAISRQLDPTH